MTIKNTSNGNDSESGEERSPIELSFNAREVMLAFETLSFVSAQRLQKQLKNIEHRLSKKLPCDKSIQKFTVALTQAQEWQKQRMAIPLKANFENGLPVSERWQEIADAINDNQVLILAGETGSGKTTQLPKICIEAGYGCRGLIGHTQPRRIAARTVASRIADEFNVALGTGVGYQIRFNDQSDASTRIKLMTDGILLAEIQRDPLLLDYEVLIIDEAHERSLNIDFLLGYLKSVLAKRPELKLIVTSATIDLQRFSKHFDDAPVIEVSGRTYPVEYRYRPWAETFEDETEAIVDTINEILTEKNHGAGDILVFLSGEREIRETAKAIKHAEFKHLEIVPLYARLSIAEQNKVFNAHKGRRVVLSTNVAETSLTVPGIRYVIDSGRARISRYSLRTKIQRLPIEAISQASANQRAGRCGRVAAGICYRLYSEEDFTARPEFTDPEILRTNLASVILQMLQLKIGDIHNFPFVDPPDKRLINDGFKLLEELNAVDSRGRVTKTGHEMSQLPVDPRYARMLIESSKLGCLNEVLIIVSGLSIQDPRERPQEKQQSADEKHRRFRDDDSDFISYVNVWNYLEEQRQELSQNQFRKLCQKEFIHYLRAREWRELHHQVKVAAKNTSLKLNHEASDYSSIHKALLIGLLTNVGALNDEEKNARDYKGTRGKVFHIFPGSGLFKKKYKWLMAAEFIETSKLFAHCVAKIDVQWVLQTADHIIKKHYSEPHYQAKSGNVCAYMSSTLWGLKLAEKQRVSYGAIDPVKSREVFIRSALVEAQYRGKGKFFQKNQSLIDDVAVLEAKVRRRDILVDDEVLYEFYDERIPEDIVNLADFEHWRKRAEIERPNLLELDESQLMMRDAAAAGENQFPDELKNGDLYFSLKYQFEPGKKYDGLNIHVPADLLHQLREYELEWLVPGLLREKCIALVKSLPKAKRKSLVPVPNFVDKALGRMKADNRPLSEALGEALMHISNAELSAEDWQTEKLDPFYQMNIVVCDENGKILDQSRDLDELRQRFRGTVQKTLRTHGDDFEKEQLEGWSLGKWQESVQLKRGNVKVKAYPALQMNKTDVALKLHDNVIEARFASAFGLCQLAANSLGQTAKYAIKELLKGKDLGLSVVNIGKREDVAQDILLAAIRQQCFSDLDFAKNIPVSDQQDFEGRINAGRGGIVDAAQAMEVTLLESLSLVVNIRKQLKMSKNALALAFTFADISEQLSALFYQGFIFETPAEVFSDYPRYLNAVLVRMEKAAQRAQKDRAVCQQIQNYWQKHIERYESEGRAAYYANAQWQEYRWMIEELRISVFAQSLKTRYPVSEKRLQAKWKESL